MIQHVIEFDLHTMENNTSSQLHLDSNREHFTKKCELVYNWLMSGREITVLQAANEGVASLPRRLKDLRESGVKISERSQNRIKVWYCTPEDIKHNQKKAA